MKIKVQYLSGERVELELVHNDTILDVKKMIQKKEGVLLDQQRLIFAGKQLEDDRTLAQCDVKSGGMLDLHFLFGREKAPRGKEESEYRPSSTGGE